jgi:thiamine-phosphate pyrophosphorylase/hydroxymethylpyrimidine kinase/phosphomethylpyrimidine kinase/thiamine-phosphate diphosphorylase
MTSESFNPISSPLGFYPVVPDAAWVRQLLNWGVRTVQLRCKALSDNDADIRLQVRTAVAAGRTVAGAQVFINDHWRHALAEGAYGVHLGQEDWAALNMNERRALLASKMRLGLSTHTLEELELAKAARPSYLAIGPIFPTTLKVMPYEPVGLHRLKLWMQHANPYPVVAIGGISLERMAGVIACGVSGVALVSAVTQAKDPQSAADFGIQHFPVGH